MKIETKAGLFELAFGFGLIPLVVSTMDRPPLMLGGRILLWGGLYVLLSIQVQRDGGAFGRSLHANRRKGWLPGLALLLGLGTALQFAAQHLGWWHPPTRLAEAGPWASLLLLVAFTITTAVPMEALLRAYLPRRFPQWRPQLLGAAIMPLFYLSSWNPATLLAALCGGLGLGILSGTRLPFWILPVLHGLGAWSLQFLRLP